MIGKCLTGRPNSSSTPVQNTAKNRTERKHIPSLLLESELINRTNGKQKVELHQNEKRNDEPGIPV